MVKNIINANGNAVPNQFIITTPNGTFFQSYRSVVAFVDNGRHLTLGRDWDYSNTTLRHLYNFLRQYWNYGIDGKKLRRMIREGEVTERDTNLSFSCVA